MFAQRPTDAERSVSVLYREPKLLKAKADLDPLRVQAEVSVLYREPKLLKGRVPATCLAD